MQNEGVEPWGTFLANGKRTSAPIFDVTFSKIELKSSFKSFRYVDNQLISTLQVFLYDFECFSKLLVHLISRHVSPLQAKHTNSNVVGVLKTSHHMK